jgi:alkylhydroperoxidase/carboxymuconolactone decarboxylase family protein YurZ
MEHKKGYFARASQNLPSTLDMRTRELIALAVAAAAGTSGVRLANLIDTALRSGASEAEIDDTLGLVGVVRKGQTAVLSKTTFVETHSYWIPG